MRELTIGTASLWDKIKFIQFVHIVLKSFAHDREQLGWKQAFDSPETVPVILFSKCST